MLNVKGKLKLKNNEVQVNERFRKREFVLTIDANSQYPQHVQFQLTQDKCGLLNEFNPGDEMNVFFNLRGREWVKDDQVKYFNSLDVWKIETVSNATNAGGGDTNKNVSVTFDKGTSPVMPDFSGGSDDLPF
ncbi:MAG: DUF3127 domain-containing protein [Bacteroidota bacterium]|jgi:single-strand DNA-binding protein